jgi:plastocyanin
VVISGTTATPATVTTTSTATLGAAPFTPVVISTDPTYVDTGVTSPSGALTVGTQYTVAGGTYTFIDTTLAGQLLTITGTVVGTTATPVTLTATIPVVTGPMVVASTAVGFVNKGVVYGTGAVSPAVAGNAVTPVSIVGGIYTFSIADAGQPVVISGTAPVTANTGTAGLLTQEAAPGGTVTYTFTATKPGTYAYYSGTQPELQIEMGMYGAVIVLPNIAMDTACPTSALSNYSDFRLAHAAYDHPQTCYDREYLFQFAEADSRINVAAETQVQACAAARAANANAVCAPVTVKTEPFIPNYFLINGRSMPDLMDGDFIPNFPSQPYNGNPHIRPGEMLLMRTIGQGRIQHPFHIHGDHARTLARDGNLIVAQVDPSPLPNPLGTGTVNRLAGPLIFTVPTVSGQAIDGLFSWSGKGLNWDVYGPTNHTCNGKAFPGYGGTAPLPTPVAMDDANYGTYLTQVAAVTTTTTSPGYDTATGENCADHGKPIPVVPPDPQIVANGLWYSGTPYLGVQTIGSSFASTPLPPGTSLQNTSAGYAYMWHSHDEREITTNDVFPGGMMMMLIIDPPGTSVDETK